MNLDEFKLATEEQIKEFGKTIPFDIIYNSHNKIETYKDSDENWSIFTYDSNGNELTLINSDGHWHKNTYDSDNNLLNFICSDGSYSEFTYNPNHELMTHKNSSGANRIALIKADNYILWYDINSKKYNNLTYKECLAYFKEYSYKYDNYKLFIKTLKNHQLNQKDEL